nr:chemotaxis protein CheB [uncultured Pseudomonas sp.]
MRVLIVDDSPSVRVLLRSVMEGAGLQVREAANGEQALHVLMSFTPDIVTMDVHMPGMDGYETTARILERHALPVVVLTLSCNAKDASTAMRALEAGALAVLEKPAGPHCANFETRVNDLLRTLLNLAQVKIVRRPYTPPLGTARALLPKQNLQPEQPLLVAIAASAGGPAALKVLLDKLLPKQPWPLLLAQHISAGFIDSFRDWLASLSSMPVHLAQEGQELLPGGLYLAPEGHHLGVDANLRARLERGNHNIPFCPSANHLFNSVAQSLGSRAIAIQLSGMGRDGAEGLAELHRLGAMTIVQEPGSAVIDAMPLAAINLQAAQLVLAPEAMATLLNTLAARSISSGHAPGGEGLC